jgi:putative integral membrane protein (TIGR02587 family)
MRVTQKSNRKMWLHELDDLVHGMSGGFLFGIPLLYTMEVWWVGSSVEAPRMLIALVATYGIVLLLNRTAGFRLTQDIRLIDAVMDSVQALAIGIICATCVLILLREIRLETPLHESLGKIVFEGIPFTLGVALANQFFREKGDDNKSSNASLSQQNGQQNGQNRASINATFADVGATLTGALVIAFNIAPTDEVPMLATAITGPWLLLIILASLLISYAIVFQANFANQKKRQQQRGIFQRPMSETIMSYLVSLLAAMLMLWFFDRLNISDPWSTWLSYTLVLGLPATIGGAAGRLAI